MTGSGKNINLTLTDLAKKQTHILTIFAKNMSSWRIGEIIDSKLTGNQ